MLLLASLCMGMLVGCGRPPQRSPVALEPLLPPTSLFPAGWQQVYQRSAFAGTDPVDDHESESVIVNYMYRNHSHVTSSVRIYWYEEPQWAKEAFDTMIQRTDASFTNSFGQHLTPMFVDGQPQSTYPSASAQRTYIHCTQDTVCISYGQYGPYLVTFTARIEPYMGTHTYTHILHVIDQRITAGVVPSLVSPTATATVP